jgi:hypothetical protein
MYQWQRRIRRALGVDAGVLHLVAREVKSVRSTGVDVAMVVGGVTVVLLRALHHYQLPPQPPLLPARSAANARGQLRPRRAIL